MKMRRVFLLAMLPSLFFFACSDDDAVKGKFDGKPVRFNSGIQGQSRASGTQWDQADAIGIYMKTSGAELSTTSTLAGNMKHTTVGSQGEFVYASPQDAIYFPADGSKVDFLAYYPYQQTITDFNYPVNVSGDQNGKFPDIDLMYSNNETGKNQSADDVSLQFVHKLATIYLDVADKGGKSLAGMKVTITGMKTKSSFSLATGTFTDDGTSVGNIIGETKATNNRAIVEAIVLPVDALSGAKVLFDIPSHGKTFEWEIPANQKYESGNRYSYEVEVKAEGGLIVLNPSSNITDWTNNDGGKIILGEDEEPTGDGTQGKPYVVSQIVEAKVGETQKWVEGYIVGSTAKTRAVGTPSTENILISATAGETDEANCIPVDISSSAVKDNLDIVTNADLIGKKVKVQGDIVNDIFGGTLSLTNITAQEGGADPGPGPNPGEPKEFFKETFGATPVASNTKIASFTGWDNASPVAYTADAKTDIRKSVFTDNHVWFPTNNDSYLTISGINASGYTNIKLKFDVTANLFGADSSMDINAIKVEFDGTEFPVESKIITKADGYYDKYYTTTVELTGKTGLTNSVLKFSSSTTDNILGLRLDNIILEGTK